MTGFTFRPLTHETQLDGVTLISLDQKPGKL